MPYSMSFLLGTKIHSSFSTKDKNEIVGRDIFFEEERVANIDFVFVTTYIPTGLINISSSDPSAHL